MAHSSCARPAPSPLAPLRRRTGPLARDDKNELCVQVMLLNLTNCKQRARVQVVLLDDCESDASSKSVELCANGGFDCVTFTMCRCHWDVVITGDVMATVYHVRLNGTRDPSLTYRNTQLTPCPGDCDPLHCDSPSRRPMASRVRSVRPLRALDREDSDDEKCGAGCSACGCKGPKPSHDCGCS